MVPGSTGNFIVGEPPLADTDEDDLDNTGTAYLQKGPYLMLTWKNTEMEVLWETNEEIEDYDTLTVKWEKQDGSGSGESPNLKTAGALNHYIITNLTPGTRYNYKIMFDERWYFSGDFMTPPADNATETTFYAYADTRTLQSDIQPLLEKNNVQLVLHGHRHYYSHSIVNGITYLVLGDGGAPQTDPYDLSALPSYDVPYEKAVRGYHFARIDVAPSGLTVNVIREIGAEPHLIDTVSIAP